LEAGHIGLTVAMLDSIYNAECHANDASPNPQRAIIDLIDAAADDCLNDGPGLNVENKVVLAIATRLRAERYIVAKLNDLPFWQDITSKQTTVLLRKFKKQFPGESDAATLLDRVSIMTPENIHLNSFMYEPILDMSDDNLRKLYTAVKALV
jgi:hypothetical protein